MSLQVISYQSYRFLVSGNRSPFLLVVKLWGKGFMTAEFFGELFFQADKRNLGKQQQKTSKPSSQCCVLDAENEGFSNVSNTTCTFHGKGNTLQSSGKVSGATCRVEMNRELEIQFKVCLSMWSLDQNWLRIML